MLTARQEMQIDVCFDVYSLGNLEMSLSSIDRFLIFHCFDRFRIAFNLNLTANGFCNI